MKPLSARVRGLRNSILMQRIIHAADPEALLTWRSSLTDGCPPADLRARALVPVRLDQGVPELGNTNEFATCRHYVGPQGLGEHQVQVQDGSRGELSLLQQGRVHRLHVQGTDLTEEQGPEPGEWRGNEGAPRSPRR